MTRASLAMVSLYASACSAQWTVLGTYPVATGQLLTADMEVDGVHAFVTYANSLQIFDVSNPSSMSLVSSVPGLSNFVALTDDPDIVLRTANWDVSKINVSDVAFPVVTGPAYSPPGYTRPGYVVGNYAIAAGGVQGVLVIDLSTMAVVASLPTGSHVMAVDGFEYVFVVDLVAFHVVDISNMLAPTIAATVLTAGGYTVRVHNKYAWVGGANKVVVVDISNPLVPTLVTTLSVSGSVRTIKFHDELAFVVADNLYVFDNSVPSAPVLCSTYVCVPQSPPATVVVTHAAVFLSRQGLTPAVDVLSGPSFCDTPVPPSVAPTPVPPPTPVPTPAPTPTPSSSPSAPGGLSPAGGNPSPPTPVPTPVPTLTPTAPTPTPQLGPANGGSLGGFQ